MEKYFLSTLAGGVAMFVINGVYVHFVELSFFPDAYISPLFYDINTNPAFFALGFLAITLSHTFLLAYLHEKIPRCDSNLWTRVWRFSLFGWFIFYAIGLSLTILTMPVPIFLILSWAISGLLQTFAASFVIIPILYSFPAPDTSCKLK